MEIKSIMDGIFSHLCWFIPSGAFLALVGFVFSNNSKNDKRVNRVYERMDECKRDFEQKYTNKNICDILHKQLREDIAEIKTDLKILLRQTNGKKNGGK